LGNTLLQTGRYTISMSTEAHDISRVPAVHLSGEGVKATFLAIATPAQESGRSYLDVANIGGTYVIRAFDSGLLGELFWVWLLWNDGQVLINSISYGRSACLWLSLRPGISE
jgi:hypothetical protein